VTVDFNGTHLVWIATKSTVNRKAFISVDGGDAEAIDLYASSVMYGQRAWETKQLPLSDHEVRIWYDPSNQVGHYFSVDAFEIEGTPLQAYASARYEETDPRFPYTSTWSAFTDASASGGQYKAAAAGGGVKVTFNGRRLDWIAVLGPNMGTADVSVDGGAAKQVPLSSASNQYGKAVFTTGNLTAGKHTVEISLNEGSKSGTSFSVDAFDVWGSLPWEANLTTEQATWVEQRLKDLSYLPGTVDGVFDKYTRGAVIAFEKWEGLTRDGVVSVTVLDRLAAATRPKPSKSGSTNPWIEINKSKQVLLFCKNGAVLYTLHVSTGSASVNIVTPSGTFSVYRKTLATSPMYLPMYINGGVAIHGYYTVPTYAASHGCIRTENWAQDVIYPLTSVGTKAYVY
jgi:N-acetylmuramoyl-L-alanine amidase